MTVIDAYWTPHVNHIRVVCDCGQLFDHQTRISLARCPRCGRAELWHGIYPKDDTGPWSEPVMQNLVR